MSSLAALAQSSAFPPMFGSADTALFAGLLIWLGVSLLVVFCAYWLIRLAVRHGSMDAARWQASGMPDRYSRR